MHTASGLLQAFAINCKGETESNSKKMEKFKA